MTIGQKDCDSGATPAAANSPEIQVANIAGQHSQYLFHRSIQTVLPGMSKDFQERHALSFHYAICLRKSDSE
jgi:hypothetical protein